MKQLAHTFARSKARAFTLLELLVVMAVILVLVALLLPALQRAKARGQAIVCMNNLRQLGMAAMAYSADAGRFPTILEWLYDLPDDLTTGKLYPYLKSKTVYLCPTQARKVTKVIWGTFPSEWHPDHSYALNCMMCHAHDVAACFAPARTVFFVEEADLPNDLPGSLSEPAPVQSGTNAPISAPAFAHGRRGNLLMADTHVVRMTEKELLDATNDPLFWFPTGDNGRSGGL